MIITLSGNTERRHPWIQVVHLWHVMTAHLVHLRPANKQKQVDRAKHLKRKPYLSIFQLIVQDGKYFKELKSKFCFIVNTQASVIYITKEFRFKFKYIKSFISLLAFFIFSNTFLRALKVWQKAQMATMIQWDRNNYG